ncbi:MAG: complex I subunit 4 family protein [Thermincolia bacterium]
MGLLTALFMAPIIGALIIIFIPKEEDKTIKIVAALSTFVSLAIALYVYGVYYLNGLSGIAFKEFIPWVPKFGINYYMGVDGISLPMVLLTALIGFTSVYASWNYDKRTKEFFVLLLILIAGVMGTFVAQDLFIFFLFYEVVVIPIYIMVLIWGSSKRVTKEYAGMKLTIYLLVGSAFLLAGLIALYVKGAVLNGAPTFSIDQLAQLKFDPQDQIWIFGLLAIGFTSLLSMWPFHSWSPDGYAGAPTAVSMIHAGVLKKIGGYGLIRIGIFILPEGAKFWAPIIIGLAVVNVAYAAMIALAQKDLKYVVGYSSVSHMGYVLIGAATLNVIGVNGAIANMFAHGVMSALFFSMIGYVYDKTHVRSIPDLGGLAHQIPRIATGFMLAGMASLGLPGLVSFIPEFTIFVSAWQVANSGLGIFYKVAAVIAILGIIITALYTLRLLANTLFGPRREEYDWLPDAKGPEMVPLVVLGSVLIIGGVFPFLLFDIINSSVEPLIAHIADVVQIGGSK